MSKNVTCDNSAFSLFAKYQNLKTVNSIVRSHAVSMSAGEVEEDGLKVESEEGVVGIGMGA